ncbi:MAG TPA: MFS transporter [Clostridia bacterium]|nr:MFS transporter [Clostridia bacterium]
MKLFRNRDTAMFLILEGIVYTMVINLYNPFIQMFEKRMGGNDFHTALLNAIPPLVAIFVLIPFGIIIEKINRKKQTIIILLAVLSIFYAAIAFVPFIPHQVKVLVYVALIGLLNFPGSLYLTTWQSYFADNFKGSYASRIYTQRSKYSSLFGLFTVLLTGLLLTVIPKSDEERLMLYQLFYGLCFVLTLLQLFFFSKVDGRPEPVDGLPSDIPSQKITREDLKGIFRNRKFLIFGLCGFVFHLSWQMAWPLFFIYNTDYARLNEFQLGLISVAAGLTMFLSYSFWNKWMEKKGSSFILIFGTLGLSLNPLAYATMLNFSGIIILNLCSGFAMAGFNLSIFCNLLECLPEEKKTVYISVFNTITNITGFIAPFIGIWLYNRTNIFIAMALTGGFRLFATGLYFIKWRRERAGVL